MGLSGNLESFSVPEILQLLALQRKSGVLRLNHADGRAQVLFIEKGRIIGTREKVGAEQDPFVEYMLGAGYLAREQVQTIVRVQQETGKDSIYIMLSGGLVGKDRLSEALTQHTQQVVDELLSWTRGSYDFQGDERALPRQALKVSLSIEELLMEGMRRMDELATIKQAVLAPDLHLLRAPSSIDRSRMSREQLVVFDMVVDSTPVEAIVARSPLGEYNTYEIIQSLLEQQIFVVDPCPPPAAARTSPAPMEVFVPGSAVPVASTWAGILALTLASIALGAALGSTLRGHALGLVPRDVSDARRRSDTILAREVYHAVNGRLPTTIEELFRGGYLRTATGSADRGDPAQNDR